MGDHDSLAWHITVPALFLAVFQNEELIFIDVALDAHRLVGGLLFLVPYGQSVVGSRLRGHIINPSHENLLIGRIARRRKAIIIIAAHAHNVPVAQAVMVAIARVIEIGQSQAMTELMGKGTDTVDRFPIVVITIQLIEYSKVVNHGVTIRRAESTIATLRVIGG